MNDARIIDCCYFILFLNQNNLWRCNLFYLVQMYLFLNLILLVFSSILAKWSVVDPCL